MSVPITRARKEKLKNKEEILDDCWKSIEVNGTLPVEMYGHTTAYHEESDSFYVFGGCSKDGAFSSLIYKFDFSKDGWQTISTSSAVSCRHFHTTVVYNNRIYMFGGKNNGYMNDLNIFDIKTESWLNIDEVSISGKPPSKRYGHTAVVYNKCIYIYGGYDDSGYKTNDLHEYRIESSQWRKIETIGSSPECFHHTSIIHQGSMYVFGGTTENLLYEYRFGTRMWGIVQFNGKIPEKRWGHCSVVYQNRLYIIGGCTTVLNFKDMHAYDFENCVWTKVLSSGLEPRYFSSPLVRNQHLYLFAGKNLHHYCFNNIEMYSFDIDDSNRPDKYFDNMLSLINCKEYTDLEIYFPKEGKSIHVHKAILSARCEKFSVMFQSGMKETLNNKIVIEDCGYKLYKLFLIYIYTSKLLKMRRKTLIRMLRISDQYMMDHLKRLCELQLCNGIEIGDINELYEESEKYNAPELKRSCINFVAKYYETLEKKNLNKTLLNKARLMRREEE